jgi:hypothetical protein
MEDEFKLRIKVEEGSYGLANGIQALAGFP